jgi:hypothetical protein
MSGADDRAKAKIADLAERGGDVAAADVEDQSTAFSAFFPVHNVTPYLCHPIQEWDGYHYVLQLRSIEA